MKKNLCLYILFLFSTFSYSQTENKPDKENNILSDISQRTCKCLDSIKIGEKDKVQLNGEIGNCIGKSVLIYQLSKKLPLASKDKTDSKNTNIEINYDKNSDGYKESYYEIQRDLFDNCAAMKSIISSIDRPEEKYIPKSQKAINAYNTGLKDNVKENWEQAKINFEIAIKADPNFAYAWDNLGLAYRKLGKYDKAIEAYQKSLKINPSGKMALQNLPAAYTYNKEYQKAIENFGILDQYYPGDPEVYYGIGQIYYEHLKQYEKSLNYMCKAFNTYTTQKSPYRTDAETIIVYIYNKMKEDGKLERFNEILKENNINPID